MVLAHRMALASAMVTSEMVEASEFPELSDEYGISGVPHTIINHGRSSALGAMPEAQLIGKIRAGLKGG